MKDLRKIMITGVLGFGLGTAAVTQAAGPWYVGAGGGWTSTNADAVDMHPNLVAEHAPTSTNVDDNDTGWKVFVGFQVNPNIAIEGSYTDLGMFTLDADITLPGVGTLSDTLEPEAWCLSGVGTLPVQNNFSINGRLGVCRWDDNFSGSHTVAAVVTPEPEFSEGTDLLIGLGGSYEFANNLSVRAEWERYFNVIHDIEDVDFYSVSVMMRF